MNVYQHISPHRIKRGPWAGALTVKGQKQKVQEKVIRTEEIFQRKTLAVALARGGAQCKSMWQIVTNMYKAALTFIIQPTIQKGSVRSEGTPPGRKRQGTGVLTSLTGKESVHHILMR